MIAWITGALAVDLSEARLGVSVGAEATTNDPIVVRHGLRVGAQLAPSRHVEIGAAAAWYPVRGQSGCDDPDWTALACQLLEENDVVFGISKITWQVQPLIVRVLPIHAELGNGWRTGVGVLAGFSLVATEDDAYALWFYGDDALSTMNQVHGAGVWGFFGDVRSERVGLRLRVETDTYVETVGGTTLEMKNAEFLGAEGVVWFP